MAMKNKTVVLGMLVCVVCFIVTANGQNVGSSAHNFSSFSWSGNQICAPCHTPHDAIGVVSEAPLWNHTLTTNDTFTPYNSSTLTATVADPDTTSKLCLSCHDGSVPLDAFGGEAGGSVTISPTYRVGSGGNLSAEHPIGFVYDAQLVTDDGGLHPITTSVLGGTIETEMLIDSKMGCYSCHDVHNGNGIQTLLKISNQNSALCLTCHDK